jgi:phage shock protein A
VSSRPVNKRQSRVVRRLQAAYLSLDAWEESLRAVAVQAPASTNDQPSQAAVLLTIVNEAKSGLERRLAELGVSVSAAQSSLAAPALKPKKRSSSAAVSTLSLCVSACRACGRALGSAFREAQSMADAASARSLYFSIRDFEKQLWVLDPRQAH